MLGLLLSVSVGAQAGAALRIEADGLPDAGPGQLAVVVETGDADAQPLLLTVTSEGDAVQVVRGRFLRADAKALPNGHLRFDVPVVVRAQGRTVVRAELLTYRCKDTCVELRVGASRMLEGGGGGG